MHGGKHKPNRNQNKEKKLIKDNFDPQLLLALATAAGYDGTWHGTMSKAAEISTAAAGTRREKPDRWTYADMLFIVDNCDLSSSDIIEIFFRDRLEKGPDKEIAAMFFHQIGTMLETKKK